MTADLRIQSKTIGRFCLLRRLGSGSYGIVYKALDTLTNRQVALKILLLDENTETDLADQAMEVSTQLYLNSAGVKNAAVEDITEQLPLLSSGTAPISPTRSALVVQRRSPQILPSASAASAASASSSSSATTLPAVVKQEPPPSALGYVFTLAGNAMRMLSGQSSAEAAPPPSSTVAPAQRILSAPLPPLTPAKLQTLAKQADVYVAPLYETFRAKITLVPRRKGDDDDNKEQDPTSCRSGAMDISSGERGEVKFNKETNVGTKFRLVMVMPLAIGTLADVLERLNNGLGVVTNRLMRRNIKLTPLQQQEQRQRLNPDAPAIIYLNNPPPPLAAMSLETRRAMARLRHRFALQCLCGILWMHLHNFIHRDIKPSNILVTADDDGDGGVNGGGGGIAAAADQNDPETWTARIGDFGLTKTTGAMRLSPRARMPDVTFTSLWRPPESICNVSAAADEDKTDNWACGITLINIYFNITPILEDNGERKSEVPSTAYRLAEQIMRSIGWSRSFADSLRATCVSARDGSTCGCNDAYTNELKYRGIPRLSIQRWWDESDFKNHVPPYEFSTVGTTVAHLRGASGRIKREEGGAGGASGSVVSPLEQQLTGQDLAVSLLGRQYGYWLAYYECLVAYGDRNRYTSASPGALAELPDVPGYVWTSNYDTFWIPLWTLITGLLSVDPATRIGFDNATNANRVLFENTLGEALRKFVAVTTGPGALFEEREEEGEETKEIAPPSSFGGEGLRQPQPRRQRRRRPSFTCIAPRGARMHNQVTHPAFRYISNQFPFLSSYTRELATSIWARVFGNAESVSKTGMRLALPCLSSRDDRGNGGSARQQQEQLVASAAASAGSDNNGSNGTIRTTTNALLNETDAKIWTLAIVSLACALTEEGISESIGRTPVRTTFDNIIISRAGLATMSRIRAIRQIILQCIQYNVWSGFYDA